MFATLVALALTAPPEPPKEKPFADAAQKELDKLQGKWKAEKLATSTQEHTVPKGDPELVAEIKGRKWIFVGVEKAEIVAIDSSTDPKSIDLKSVEKGRNATVDEAIYKLDGDTLTICLYQGEGKKRPTAFDTPKESDTILAVFKRVKDEPREEKEKELTEAANKELKALEGKWRPTKMTIDGTDIPAPEGDDGLIEFKARKFLLGGKDFFDVTSLDPSADPKLIDFKGLQDMGDISKGTTYEAIYKLDKNTFTIALYFGSGQKRPDKFESGKDSKVALVTFEREKK